ncbi:MAG: baseplate J/gp47 family protein, partial [Bacteroidota bacterium]
MAKKCDHTFLTLHPGTEQSQRLKDSLLPENYKLNDFTTSDWMEFAYNFANQVNYFDLESDKVPTDNWESFFVQKDAIDAFVATLDTDKRVTPHLTLFVAFLKLLELTKERFNKITKRHLDFYYREILQIGKKAPKEDQVHLIFELAKNAKVAKIDEGTLLEAGKDAKGIRMQYATNNELVANKAQVAALKSIYHHRKNKSTELNGLFAADQVNSRDGKGEPFKDDNSWLPFGYPAHHNTEFPLETPTLGFAMAAPTLALKEGDRFVKVTYQLEKNIGTIDVSKFAKSLQIYATGEKGWIGPFQIQGTAKSGYTSTISGKVIRLSFMIDKTQEPVVAYNQEIHGDQYDTNHPLLKFELLTQQPAHKLGYTFYTQVLTKKLKSAQVDVSVEDIVGLELRNDIGELVPDKPFYPFGTQPVERSAFYIGYEEAFQKKWSNISINAKWLNTPDNFKDHYLAYRRDASNKNLTPQLYYQTLYHTFDAKTGVYTDTTKQIPIQKATTNINNLYVTGNDYFTAKVNVIDKEVPKPLAGNLTLFTDSNSDKIFETNLSVSNANYTTGENGPIKLSLNQSFLHSVYPKVYALALTNDKDTLLPNEPYTPMIETMTMSYGATQKLGITEKTTTADLDEIELFHIHPYGQAKNQETLVPTYCKGGELYIALEHTEKLQNVSLLFQLLEGTENPLAEPFLGSEKIQWAILTGNDWLTLDSTMRLGDTTDNFLKSGIVTVTIPREATEDHTLLPSGYVWLRALSDKSFDAVCKFIDVHAQVIPATFKNQGNDLAHLEGGLAAGTIAKLTQRDALVKKVTQPYNSFGGQPEETNESYYKRVSERIRHKDRAVKQWDYEHLILEKFKDIYKVKCLNHTKGDSYHAPGYVSLVVIPDIVNNNAFDIYQPRVSTAKRNEIDAYINNLNSFFVNAEIVNPDYEEIEITTDVKFS